MSNKRGPPSNDENTTPAKIKKTEEMDIIEQWKSAEILKPHNIHTLLVKHRLGCTGNLYYFIYIYLK